MKKNPAWMVMAVVATAAASHGVLTQSGRNIAVNLQLSYSVCCV